MKPHASSAEPTSFERGVYTIATNQDFIPIPPVRLKYRGLDLSRSSTLRLIKAGEFRVVRVRVTGGTKGRTFILRDSIDAWLERELARPENTHGTQP